MSLRTLKNWYWRWKLRREPLSRLFDPVQYLKLHRDVAVSGQDPTVHYLRFGRWEGRDPGPNFSASGYLLQHQDVVPNTDPLSHWSRIERGDPHCLPELEGAETLAPDVCTVLVFGHQAGKTLYGAERSLLETLDAMTGLAVNRVVVLPSALNPDYVEAVRARCAALFIAPMGWWHRSRPSVPETVRHICGLIERYDVDLVYVNTLVLDEPLAAARQCGVRTAVHVRELPARDKALCETLGATPEQVIERLRATADVVVANSRYTAQSLGLDNIWVIANGITCEAFADLPAPAQSARPFTVGMISSNLPKKGLFDFMALAAKLSDQADVRCHLVGPENEWVARIKQNSLPKNLVFVPYVETPQQALADIDVLVNLSHFEESFGRSVLEAMAAGRPVVAYRWGALPELIEDGETGYLVPMGDVDGVCHRVRELASDLELCKRLGAASQRRAAEEYDVAVTRQRLEQVMRRLLSF